MKILSNDIAVIEGDTHISKWVEMSGRLDHDQNVLPLLDPYLRGTAVDIGAFIGDHTEYYAQRCLSVLALEPNQAAFECLRHNMSKHPHVTCMNVGASDTLGSMGLETDPNAGAAYAKQQGEIPVVTIDKLYLSACHFMKIDAEGMEPKILAGARQTIAMYMPVMFIEVNEGALKRQNTAPDAIFAFLEEYGYDYRNIYPRQKMEGPQYDILCTPTN